MVIASLQRFRSLAACMALSLAVFGAASPAPAADQARPFVQIPPDKDSDLRVFETDGTVTKGARALGGMQSGAGLVLGLAGNQFFAMEEVVRAFQKSHPAVSVGVVTLPPGLVLQAVQAGGWTYGGRDYPFKPDIYGSVSLGHLKSLRQSGEMREYLVYMHNELQLIVAKGNPKGIKGIADLGRPDVKTSLPNPVNEGIMQFYARKVLERHKLWDALSAGQECVSCQTTPTNWFTAVHHRETPERIRDGKSDVGIVWKTEVLEALRDGAAIDAVELPVEDSLRDEVSYVIGALAGAPHSDAARAYLTFLGTPAAQDAYASFGFVKATDRDLRARPIQ